jgi:hypothetical protein
VVLNQHIQLPKTTVKVVEVMVQFLSTMVNQVPVVLVAAVVLVCITPVLPAGSNIIVPARVVVMVSSLLDTKSKH